MFIEKKEEMEGTEKFKMGGDKNEHIKLIITYNPRMILIRKTIVKYVE